MRALRASAVAALALLGIYFGLRFAGAACSGAGCDAYVWPSLALPVGVVVLVAVTGWLAMASARRQGSSWFVPLIVCTALGVFGPMGAVAVFRDSPDAVVAVATAFLLVTPVAALAYSFRKSPSPHP